MSEESKKEKLKIYLEIAKSYPYFSRLELDKDEVTLFLKCLLVIRTESPSEEDIAASIFGINRDFGSHFARSFYQAVFKEIKNKNLNEDFLKNEDFYAMKNSIICASKDVGDIIFDTTEV